MSESFTSRERFQEEVQKKEYPLVNWGKLRSQILEAFSMETWPDTVLSVINGTEGELEVVRALEQENLTFGNISLEDFGYFLEEGPSVYRTARQAELDYLRKKLAEQQRDSMLQYTKKSIFRGEQELFLLETLFESHKPGLILFHATSKTLPGMLKIAKQLPPNIFYTFIVSDPPHTWESFAKTHPAVPFFELEDRVGIEMRSESTRQAAVEKVIDYVATRLPLGPVPNPLIRALRKELIPSSDIGIERDVIAQLMTTDHTAFNHLVATQSERETRWKQLPLIEREKSAAILEAYARPIDGNTSYAHAPETHAEIVLRLFALDPHCLPESIVQNAKKTLHTFLRGLLEELAHSSEENETPTLRSYLVRLADRAIISASTNDVFREVVAFRAHAAVENFLFASTARSKSLLREILRYLKRAIDFGNDMRADLEALHANNFDLLPENIPTETNKPSASLEDIDARIGAAVLFGSSQKHIRTLLEKKQKLLEKTLENPAISQSELRANMSIAMSIAAQEGVMDLTKELKSINDEFQRRLAVSNSVNPREIKAIKTMLLEEWFNGWRKKIDAL